MNNRLQEEENQREALYLALRTRPLTTEEMGEVAKHGDYLNIPLENITMEPGGSSCSGFRRCPSFESVRQLNDAYVTQFRLQQIAAGKG